jgi:hypothetical protein
MVVAITIRQAARLLDNTCHCHWLESKLTIEIVDLTFQVFRISLSSSSLTWAEKAGLRFHWSEEHPARSRARRLHHTVPTCRRARTRGIGSALRSSLCKAQCQTRPPRRWVTAARAVACANEAADGCPTRESSCLVILCEASFSDTDYDIHSCERCRRQKIKCSGKEPCDACQKRQLLCNFDEQNQKILVTRESVESFECACLIKGFALLTIGYRADNWLNFNEEPARPPTVATYAPLQTDPSPTLHTRTMPVHL